MSRDGYVHPLRALWILAVLGMVAMRTSFAQTGAEGGGTEAIGDLLKGKKYTEALALCERALEKEPEKVPVLMAKSKALVGLGRYKEAGKLAFQCAEKHPELPEFQFIAGEFSYRMGIMPLAAQTFQKLCDGPESAWSEESCFMAAKALLAIGREAEARERLRSAMVGMKKVPLSLFSLYFELRPPVKESLALAEKVETISPEGLRYLEVMKKILSASKEGSLCEESLDKALPVDLPLRMNEHELITKVTFNGKAKRWWPLDTGAEILILPPLFADELNLKPLGEARYSGMGDQGIRRGEWALLDSLEVGPLKLRNVPAIIADRKSDSSAFWNCGLPLSLFRQYAILHDRRHGRLAIYRSGTEPKDVFRGGYFSVRSLWLDFRPFAEVKIGDVPSAFMLVDTGGAEILAAEYADRLGIRPNTGKYSSVHGSGYSGRFLATIAEQVRLEMAGKGFFWQVMPVAPMGFLSDFDCYGILGRDFLGQFEMFFDYQRNTVAFRGYDKWDAGSEEGMASGSGSRPRGDWENMV